MSRPEKCQNCGYSSRYCKQLPGEILVFCSDCHAWMCAACRKARSCDENHIVATVVVTSSPQPDVPAEDGIYAHIADTVYHADPTSLSSSGARILVNQSPADFRQAQDEPPDPKPQYDFGHAAHKMVLGEGSQLVRVDANDWRTGDAQKARNKAWAEGKAPLLKKDIDKAQRMAGMVHSHPVAARLFSAGTPETSIYWTDEQTGVRLRCRPDWLPDRPGRMLCVDYKTAVSADPRKFEKAALDYGYHQQAAWYLDGLAAIGLSDDAAFLFVVQQKTAPFLVSLVQIQPEHVELGRRQNRRAIQIFADCVASRSWPGYGDGIHMVGLPSWAVSRIESALADA